MTFHSFVLDDMNIYLMIRTFTDWRTEKNRSKKENKNLC